jgi:hypothetical protein
VEFAGVVKAAAGVVIIAAEIGDFDANLHTYITQSLSSYGLTASVAV